MEYTISVNVSIPHKDKKKKSHETDEKFKFSKQNKKKSILECTRFFCFHFGYSICQNYTFSKFNHFKKNNNFHTKTIDIYFGSLSFFLLSITSEIETKRHTMTCNRYVKRMFKLLTIYFVISSSTITTSSIGSSWTCQRKTGNFSTSTNINTRDYSRL